MKITCLVDNNVIDDRLWGEHGLSVLLESQGTRVLYDAGSSGDVLLHNLKALGIDPGSIDAVVLSHGHDDHAGGLAMLSPLLRDVPLYAHPEVFSARFGGRERRPIGLDRSAIGPRLQVRLAEGSTPVAPGIRTSGEVTERPHPEGRGATHAALMAGAYVPDPYRDDLSLFATAAAGTVVVCGCAHAGLLNVLDLAKEAATPIAAVVGGTHLRSANGEQLRAAGDYLEALPGADLYLGHCTGFAASGYLLRRFPLRTRAFGAGSVLEFADEALV